jgi:hypothetical protein
MFKKTLAALAAVLLGVGLSVAAVAAPASAHTGDLNATYQCVDGKYQVTYTLTIAKTDAAGTTYWRIGTSDFEGTPKNNNGMAKSIATNGSGNYVLTTITLPGNAKKAPWGYAYSVWPNYAVGSDGGDIALPGNCVPPEIPVTVKTAPSVTDPTCTTGGKLVIPAQEGIKFEGGNDGDTATKTYYLTAKAAEGYKLTGTTTWTLTVKPADPAKCKLDPKTSIDVGVCTPTQDNKSQKSTTFWFDNSASEAAVTFTIPTLNITQVVAAGAKISVDGPKVDHNVGGSWEVLANGKPLKTLTVEKFAPCLTNVIPGDPESADQKCLAGELTEGSITVKPKVGQIVYVITGGKLPEAGITVPDNNPVTKLPAGKYTVTAHGIGGVSVGPDNTWTYDITVGKPVDCEKVTIPTSTMSQLQCVNFALTGSYTLPETKWVDWYVNGVLATAPKEVKVPGDVAVEARITAAGIAAGIVFTDGSKVVSVTHKFVLPVGGCDLPPHALLNPTASQNNGSCTADPTYTLSNTVSENGGVQWWIGDPQVKTAAGTHKAGWGTTVVIQAKLADPKNDGWEKDAQTAYTFKFPAKPACGDLLTLALTGSSTGGFVPWIAGAALLLLMGGAGIYFRRRLVTATK